VRGAYDVLVSMGIINYFLPYLLMFAAMAKLQGRPAGPEVRQVPGGRPVAIALAIVGFVATAVTIVLSVIPADEEPNKPLAIAKVLVSTMVLIAAGVVTFQMGKKKRRSALGSPGSEEV
jgi:amino acid transporter